MSLQTEFHEAQNTINSLRAQLANQPNRMSFIL